MMGASGGKSESRRGRIALDPRPMFLLGCTMTVVVVVAVVQDTMVVVVAAHDAMVVVVEAHDAMVVVVAHTMMTLAAHTMVHTMAARPESPGIRWHGVLLLTGLWQQHDGERPVQPGPASPPTGRPPRRQPPHCDHGEDGDVWESQDRGSREQRRACV